MQGVLSICTSSSVGCLAPRMFRSQKWHIIDSLSVICPLRHNVHYEMYQMWDNSRLSVHYAKCGKHDVHYGSKGTVYQVWHHVEKP